METWPASLPDIMLGFSSSAEGSGLRSTIVSAPVQTSRFQANRQQHTVKWIMREFQYAMFQSFWKYKLHLGNDDFLVELPFGNGLEEVKARFVDGAFKASFTDPHWIVSATIEVDNPPIPAP